MDFPKFIVSNQKEGSIVIQKVTQMHHQSHHTTKELGYG